MQELQNVVPSHLGLILDGNRRWAKKNNLKSIEGHRRGFDTFKTISEAALERGVKYLSVYAFSTENWARSKSEINFLMTFIKQLLKNHVAELHKKGVRFIWLGCTDKLDSKIINLLQEAEKLTKNNKKATFALCFNYGGQQEIIDASKSLVAKGLEISADNIQKHLYGGDSLPNVDFIIRTSGESRISNFMLWRAAYSELYFSDVLWPDFTVKDLDSALNEYAKRQRRYGK
jgi:undecaprenyl diphosphate synthase